MQQRPTRRMSLCLSYMNSADADRLYVKNLNDKINKNELKRALYMLFSTYGPVLDIVTTRVGAKKQNMRGQAHIVYRDIQTSTQAMRALQGFELFDKEMVIVYGRGQSSVIPRLRGTFEAPSTTVESQATDLQKSIFNAPPQNVPSKPVKNGAKPEAAQPPTSQGLKRPREDEDDDEQSDAPMEEDEDDAPMEEDDDD
jgi:U2 small nuclear ribonucleoprotein B''